MENTQQTINHPNTLQYCKCVNDRRAQALIYNLLGNSLGGINCAPALRIMKHRAAVQKHAHLAQRAQIIARDICNGDDLPKETNQIAFRGIAERVAGSQHGL